MFDITISYGARITVLKFSEPVLLADALVKARAELSMPCDGRGNTAVPAGEAQEEPVPAAGRGP